jgi:hypothetical protein
MTLAIDGTVDAQQNQIQNAVGHRLGSAPASPVDGQTYHNTADGHDYTYNGVTTTWEQASGGGGTGTVTNVTATAPLHVANPTTTPALTIDAATGSIPGSMSAADKAKLDAATNAATASAIVQRDGSGDIAVHNWTANKGTITGTPSADTDAATMGVVRSLINGLDRGHDSMRAATTAALPANTYSAGVLTATANGALPAQDGVTLVVGDRLLVKNEATAANNGLYAVTQVGSGALPYILTRVADADVSAEVTAGLAVLVTEGTANGGTEWFLSTPDPITLGTTGLTFTELPSAKELTVDATLTRTGQQLGLAVPVAVASGGTGGITAAAARTNLGGLARGAAATITGDGSTTTFTFNHGLGSTDIVVNVWELSAGTHRQLLADVRYTDANNVTLNGVLVNGVALGAGVTLRVVVMALG